MTKDIEKKSCGDWQEGEDLGQAGPTPMVWWLRIRRDVPAIGSRLRSEESQPHTGPQSGTPVPGAGVPITSGCDNQRRLYLSGMGGCWRPWTSFWGAHAWLTCSLTHLWALMQRQQLQKHLAPVGGATLTGSRRGLRSGVRAVLSWDGSTGRCFQNE